MSDWHSHILDAFVPSMHRLTLAEDPDGLLTDERLQAAIREKGFQFLRFEEAIAFRYAYESHFRARWDQGDRADLVAVLPVPAIDLLPFDILNSGRRVALGVDNLFPTLNRSVVAELGVAHLDALSNACERLRPSATGENATKDFALRHVYGIVPDAIAEPQDLLHMLLSRHYADLRIPPSIDERLVQLLRQHHEFSAWPLESIVPNRAAFLDFLQERWPVFLDQAAASDSDERNAKTTRPFSYPGPAHLPFNHADIRVYIDNLFVEGQLQAVQHPAANDFSKTWFRVGLRMDAEHRHEYRLERLLEQATSQLPEEAARHADWLRFSKVWAELLALTLEAQSGEESLQSIQTRVDVSFSKWLASRYAGLANLPPVPPVMLHHVPRLLATELREQDAGKVALLVVDGLALDQWVVLRRELSKQRPSLRLQEDAVFAWVPTVTSVSRQAIFAGRPPLYFPDKLHTTDREPILWKQFWEREGIDSKQVAYRKSLGQSGLDAVAKLVERPDVRVLGLVVDTVDKIMHGMALGAAGMHNQVRQWAAGGYFAGLLDLLLQNGYQIFLTSDHGNIEAHGCGRPAEGVIADVRGERVRIYPDETLRRQMGQRFPSAWQWPSVGLPDDCQVLLAPNRSAFVREGQRVVCHGGACIEEVIVPLVRIEGTGS